MSETGPARIVVIGAPGSGTTTLAADLAKRVGSECVALDARFHGPGSEPVGDVAFQEERREGDETAMDRRRGLSAACRAEYVAARGSHPVA